MEPKSRRPRTLRVMGAARRIGASAALMLIALAVTLGTLAAPASATAVAKQPAAAAVAAPSRPAGGEPNGMDLAILATVAAPVLAFGALVACRPRLAQRRLIRRFRAEIRDCDLFSL